MSSHSWFLILAFNFKEEVTQTKRERERQIETIVHFRERFLRERARENQRETLEKNFWNQEEEKEHKF